MSRKYVFVLQDTSGLVAQLRHGKDYLMVAFTTPGEAISFMVTHGLWNLTPIRVDRQGLPEISSRDMSCAGFVVR